MKRITKIVFCIALGIGTLIAATAGAEISTNLRKVTIYTTRNQVEQQSFVDADGNVVVAEDLGYAVLKNSFTTGTKLARTDYYDADGHLVNNKQGFASRVLVYTMRNIREEYFLDAAGNPTAGPDGYARMEGDWYAGKRHIETRYYDAAGNLYSDGKQYARMVTEYQKNKWDRPVSETYYDADGNMMRGPNGYARVEYEYVKGTSNVCKTTYLDASGALYYYKRAGYAILERTNKNGRFIKDAYYGADGELCAGPSGYAYVEKKYDNNEKKPTREAYFDAKGQPFKMPGGYYIVTRKYAKGGRTAEEAYYDAEGNPCLGKDGYHQIRTTYRRDGKITQQFYVGLDGKWMVHPTLGYAILVNDYDGTRVTAITYYDANKKPMDAAEGFAKVVYSYKEKKITGMQYLHADGSPAIGPEGYASAAYTTDKDGNVLTEVYYGTDGQPTADARGVYEAHFTWDGKNKASERYFRDGEPAADPQGIHAIETKYNGDGKVTETATYGITGEPALNEEGYARKTTEYLANAKVAAEKYYDANGQLIRTPGKEYAYQLTEFNENGDGYTVILYDTENRVMMTNGYAAQVCEIDEEGRITRTSYTDASGEPTVSSAGVGSIENTYNEEGLVETIITRNLAGEMINGGNGYAMVWQGYDQYGNISEERYYGTEGQPVKRNGGYAILRRTYQSRGKLTEVSYYGLDEEPVRINSGYAREVRTLDEAGNVTAIAYYGVDGEKTEDTNGYAEIRREYNGKRQNILEAWFDRNGTPVHVRNDEYFAVAKEYDENGNNIAERYLDAEGNPAASKNGYDEIRREYNKLKQITSIAYYRDGTATADINGCAVTKREYDDVGAMTAESYYGTSGEPIVHQGNKYHRTERTYLDKSHVSSEAWFDAEGAPVAPRDTYVRVDHSYDGAGNKTADIYYGADGEKIACNAGYDEVQYAYNEQNRVAWIGYYLEGSPVQINNGAAAVEREYDDAGNMSVERYYGVDGLPKACNNGYDEMRQVFNGDRRVIRIDYLLKGEPKAVSSGAYAVERDYDEAGNMTVERYYGADGSQAPVNAGYDEIRQKFNEDKKVIRIDYLLGGVHVLNNNNAAAVEREYDAAGNMSVERYYGINGKKAACKAGYDEMRQVFNENKKVIRIDYLLKGEPFQTSNGVAAVERDYDEAGNMIVERYYGADGKQAPQNAGYDEMRQQFNEDKKVIRIDYLLAGARVLNSNNAAAVEREYDAVGNMTVERYYDADGAQAACKAGYDEMRQVFNENKKVIRIDYLLGGEPFEISNGAAAVEREYDEAGNMIVERYYGADGEQKPVTAGNDEVHQKFNEDKRVIRIDYLLGGEPVLMNNGAASIEREYDAAGNMSVERYYGVDGQPKACNNGYDEMRQVFNGDRRVIRIDYLLGGEPKAVSSGAYAVERDYDEAGNMTVERYYGADGNQAPLPTGQDEIHQKFNENKKVIRIDYLLGGAPVLINNGAAAVEREYDAAGNMSVERYYGTDGQPKACNNGYDEMRQVFNENKKVIRIDYLLGGEPFQISNGAAAVERDYDEAGNMIVERYYGADGNQAPQNAGYDEIRQKFNEDKKIIRIDYLLAGAPVLNNNNAAAVEREYDAAGNMTVERYYGVDGAQAACKAGYDEMRQVFNENKKVIRIDYLLGGEPFEISNGAAAVEREYDAAGNMSVERYYGTDGQPKPCNGGYDEMRQVFNENKKVIRVDYLLNGEPFQINNGAASMEREYDAAGNMTVERYYGTDGQPKACNGGYDEMRQVFNENRKPIRIQYYLGGEPFKISSGAYGVERDYDAIGNVIVERYLGADGNMAPLPTGQDEIHQKFNENKKVIRIDYLLNGAPVLINNGAASVEREYDAAGNMSVERYYGTDGQPKACNGGYDELRQVFNENKKVIRIDYLLGGEPKAVSSGAYSVERDYDEAGNMIVERYYGADGSQAPLPTGQDEIRQKFNENRKVIRIDYLLNGEPVLINNGAAAVEREYDAAGNMSVERYYGVDGQPKACNGGYDEMRQVFNENKKVIRVDYLLNGEPFQINNGSAAMEREYDAAGNMTVERYFGTDGQPKPCNGGYDEMRQVFNENKKVIRVDYLLGGEPFQISNGAASMEREYDAAGNMTVERYYGVDGQPKACNGGYDEMHQVFNENKKPIRIQYYLGGEPFKMGSGAYGVERDYDAIGNVIVERYLGADGNMAPLPTGQDEIHQKFNENKKVIRIDYLLNGEPVLINNGAASVEREYDEAGNMSVERYYGVDGQPKACNGGYDEMRQVFNENKKVIRIDYLLGGEPYKIGSGAYSIERDYDEAGNMIVERYFGADGKQAPLPTGQDEIHQKFNENKKVIRIDYLLGGEPVLINNGAASIEREYDAAGNMSVERYYGVDGQPKACNGGYDEMRQVFNENKKVIRVDYLLNGEPFQINNGAASMEREYDAAGNMTVERYYGVDGQPKPCNGGYDEMRQVFNENKKVIRVDYLLNGEPYQISNGAASMEREYDAAGNMTVERYYGVDGLPKACNGGYDEMRQVFNENRKPIRIQYYLGGEPFKIGSGAYGVERDYDTIGNVIVERYLGADGNMAPLPTGQDEIHQKFNENKKVIRIDYLLKGEPVLMNNGAASVEREYDAAGNMSVERYYGVDGMPKACNAGYDELRQVFNENKLIVRMEYHSDGAPVLNNKKIAALEREYDEQNLVAVERYYGVDGERVRSSDGYSRIDRTWFDKNHVQTEAWFDENDEPMAPKDTYCKCEYEYDENGNRSVIRYYGADGQPIACKAGYDEIHQRFNEKKQIIRIYYLLGGQPVLINNGAAAVEREYDDAGNMSVERYYGTDGLPKPCNGGYDEMRQVFNENKKVIRVDYLLNGEPFVINNGSATMEREYDAAGNMTVERYYGVDGAQAACKSGYDEMRQVFNENKKVIRVDYLLDGEPFLINNGSASMEREYDAAGNMTVERYYGTDGQPKACNGGYDELRQVFNDDKRVIRIQYYLSGEPFQVGSGAYGIERDYDAIGNVIVERYLGADGNKAPVNAGHDEIHQKFNADKRIIRIDYLLNGEPFETGNRACSIEREYDAAGNISEERYYGTKGEPILITRGYHKVETSWTEQKKKASETYYGTEGEPILCKDGYGRIEWTYNEKGEVETEKKFGIDGNEIIESTEEPEPVK